MKRKLNETAKFAKINSLNVYKYFCCIFQRDNIAWFKDGSKLSSRGLGRFRISTIKTSGGWVSTITIKEFNENDIGTFKLFVENGKANVERRISVVVAT